MMRNSVKGAALVLSFGLSVGVAEAATTTVSQGSLVPDGNYYTNNIGSLTLAPNDDGSTALINLGFTVNFFGTNYSSLYINNNGNVSFTAPISDYVPTGPTGVNAPIISAWFGDVDTRSALSGVVHYQLDTPGQLIVTWDNVGRYASRGDQLNSFQLVLRGSSFSVPVGEGNIGFFYRAMPWEVTDTSTTAAIGFGDGAGNAVVLQGSNTPGLNAVVANKHIWFNQNLTPVDPAVPEPATWAMLILGFGVIGWTMRYKVRQSDVRFDTRLRQIAAGELA